MTSWTSDEPARIGAAEELQIAARRRDASTSATLQRLPRMRGISSAVR